MEQQEQIQDILDIVIFIKDNAVTKDEFKELKDEVCGLKNDVNGLKQDVSGLKNDVSGLKNDVNGLKQDVRHIQNVMVTKDYLDDKLADLHSDLVILMRKEDAKLKSLIQSSS